MGLKHGCDVVDCIKVTDDKVQSPVVVNMEVNSLGS
jgi:hypothetical protein